MGVMDMTDDQVRRELIQLGIVPFVAGSVVPPLSEELSGRPRRVSGSRPGTGR